MYPFLFSNLGNIIDFNNLTQEDIFVLDSPILTNSQLKKFKGYQDIDRRVPDNSKLKKIIIWKPIYSLEYGLRSMISDLTK